MRGRTPILALPAVAMALVIAACEAGGAGGTAAPASSSAAPAVRTPTPAPASPIPDEAVPWILFVEPDLAGEGRGPQLLRLHPETREAVPALPAGPPSDGSGATWSPDGARFAFMSWDPPARASEPDAAIDLWIADWDGGSPVRVVDCTAPCWLLTSAAWSPDGRQIAFNRIDVVDGEVVGSGVGVVDVATGRVETILEVGPPELAGVLGWPTGRSRPLVARGRLRSTSLEQLSGAGSWWSDEGLAIVDLDEPESTPRPLPPLEMELTGSAWHPDGDAIVLSGGDWSWSDVAHSTSELYAARGDFEGVTRLTDLASVGAGALFPSWVPDGSAILFSLWHRATWTPTLAVVAPDGSGLVELGGDDPIVGLLPVQRPIPAMP
jgi:dipeptidyl aminopeptidase/acylaminoacyl peptidase